MAVHAGGGCAPEVQQSSERYHLRFVLVWTNTPILFHRYDHINNARCGVIYPAQTNQHPVEIIQQFQQGNSVVMGSDGRFNQVDPDHSQDWLNGTRKRAGGIVGITQKHSQPLSRWALSCNVGLRLQPQQGRLLISSHSFIFANYMLILISGFAFCAFTNLHNVQNSVVSSA